MLTCIHVLNELLCCSFAGKKNKIKWKDIKVGDIIKVEDDELFPADLLCLNTGLQDGVCFIKTTNLDGESNLKIRKSVDLRSIPEGFYLPTSCDSEVRPKKYCHLLVLAME